MQINTLSKFAHRHFVAAPIAAMLFLAGMGLSSTRPFLAAVDSGAEQGSGSYLRLEDGVWAEPTGDVLFDTFERPALLGYGTVLVGSRGPFQVRVGSARVTGVDGTFYLSYVNGNLTVAGITSPAVLRFPDGAMLVVPAGKQWRQNGLVEPLTQDVDAWSDARALHAVSAEFLADQLRRSEMILAQPAPSLPVIRSDRPMLASRGWLQLWSSVLRMRRDDSDEVLGHLQWLAEQNDADGLVAFLQDPEYGSLVTVSPFAPHTLLHAAANTENPVIARSLLAYLQSHRDLWMAASLHPTYVNDLWTLSAPESLGKNSTLAQLFALPHSDVQREGLHDGTVTRWRQSMEDFVRSSSASGSLISMTIRTVGPLALEMQQNGYPERAQRYSAAVLSLAAMVAPDTLPVQTRALLPSLDILARQPIVLSGHDAKQDNAAWQASEMEMQTQNALEASGGIVTLKTRFDAATPGIVGVHAVSYASPIGTRTFDFTYDPETQMVDGIVLNGEMLPYGLPLKDFAAWAKSGE